MQNHEDGFPHSREFTAAPNRVLYKPSRKSQKTSQSDFVIHGGSFQFGETHTADPDTRSIFRSYEHVTSVRNNSLDPFFFLFFTPFFSFFLSSHSYFFSLSFPSEVQENLSRWSVCRCFVVDSRFLSFFFSSPPSLSLFLSFSARLPFTRATYRCSPLPILLLR